MQLGGHLQIVLGAVDRGVPEVGRQHRHPGLQIGALAVPAQQGMHREGVPLIPAPGLPP